MSAKERIKEMKERMSSTVDIDELAERSFISSASELSIIHEDTGASFRMRDNGNVEIFSQNYSGIVLSSTGKSVNTYSDYMNIFSEKTHIQTEENGLIWNYHVFNPDMAKIRLLICTDQILEALNKLMNGGIQIIGECAVGPVTGQTLPTAAGVPQDIKPFIYDAKPELINKDFEKAADSIEKVI